MVEVMAVLQKVIVVRCHVRMLDKVWVLRLEGMAKLLRGVSPFCRELIGQTSSTKHGILSCHHTSSSMIRELRGLYQRRLRSPFVGVKLILSICKLLVGVVWRQGLLKFVETSHSNTVTY